VNVSSIIRFQGGPIAWIADNFHKGISRKVPSITVHASAEFSRLHWDTPPEEVADILFQDASGWIKSDIRSSQLHRWRYSQPVEIHPSPCLMVDAEAPLVFAGDAFGGPRIEGAALSGLAAAENLLASER
jgi:predicted NAD/FAD-dependent oxidoreductase